MSKNNFDHIPEPVREFLKGIGITPDNAVVIGAGVIPAHDNDDDDDFDLSECKTCDVKNECPNLAAVIDRVAEFVKLGVKDPVIIAKILDTDIETARGITSAAVSKVNAPKGNANKKRDIIVPVSLLVKVSAVDEKAARESVLASIKDGALFASDGEGVAGIEDVYGATLAYEHGHITDDMMDGMVLPDVKGE